jgi:hypothetical protein
VLRDVASWASHTGRRLQVRRRSQTVSVVPRPWLRTTSGCTVTVTGTPLRGLGQLGRDGRRGGEPVPVPAASRLFTGATRATAPVAYAQARLPVRGDIADSAATARLGHRWREGEGVGRLGFVGVLRCRAVVPRQHRDDFALATTVPSTYWKSLRCGGRPLTTVSRAGSRRHRPIHRLGTLTAVYPVHHKHSNADTGEAPTDPRRHQRDAMSFHPHDGRDTTTRCIAHATAVHATLVTQALPTARHRRC